MEPEWIDRVPEFIVAARDGDRHALGILFEVFRPFLIQLASGQVSNEVRSKTAASDLVQQSLLDAHENFHAFRGGTQADLASWLRQILENNCIDLVRRFRSLKREVAREVPLEAFHTSRQTRQAANDRPDHQALLHEQAEVLEECLENLSLEHRLVIRLRQKENLSFAKIGDLLNRSEEAARKLWARAIEQLRREIDSRTGDHDEAMRA
jgi:RNA polymerase sigma-70 factor (ECF subfamily)